MKTVGIAVQSGGDGDAIDIVVYGPVECMTGGDHRRADLRQRHRRERLTAGTKTTIIGYAETATILFVRPQACRCRSAIGHETMAILGNRDTATT